MEEEMDKSIVCGVDGSPNSMAALRVAAELAERLGSRLVLAHVADPVHRTYVAAAPYGGVGMTGSLTVEELRRSQQEVAEDLLDQIAREAGTPDAERRVVSGVPAEGLSDLADEVSAELIVVGSRGRGAFRAAFLGSVSYSLVGVARCPVLVVPHGAT